MSQRLTAKMHFALLLVFTLWVAHSCTADLSTYDIHPVDTCSETNAECLTLSDVVRKKDTYFLSNSTLIFHPGEHSLQGEVVSVANIQGITLQGLHYRGRSSSAPKILCVNSSFSFSGVIDLQIVSIGFIACRIGLHFTDAAFQDSRFENSTRGAVAVFDRSSLTLSGVNTFAGNTAGEGGAIVARNSNLTFYGDTTFEANEAQYFGGALFVTDLSWLYFNGSVGFEANTAAQSGSGGALYTGGGSRLDFNGNISFEANTAGYCGALCADEGSMLDFNGNSSFEANTAVYGGALCALGGSRLDFNGNTSFEANIASYPVFDINIQSSGGALYADGAMLDFNGNVSFENNTAGFYGGALFTWNSRLYFNGDISFEANAANYGDGGALCVWEGSMLDFNGNISFEANIASSDGGALYAEGGLLDFNGSISFEANTAYQGYGGALYVGGCNMDCNGNISFEANTANYGGGALYASGAMLDFNGNITFESNTAGFGGGALYAYTAMLDFNGNVSFENNTADEGGVLYTDAYIYYELDNISFEVNTADFGGGAVYASLETVLNFTGNSSFIGNSAKVGGGIFSQVTNVSHSGNVLFCYNSATLGGGMAIRDSHGELTGTVQFKENEALYGGGVFVQDGSITVSGSGLFLGNNATQYGGAIHATSSRVSFDGSYTISRNAAGFGGGLALTGLDDRILLLKPGTHLAFQENLAHRRGGALYVEDRPFTYCVFDVISEYAQELCFFQVYEFCELLSNYYRITCTPSEYMHFPPCSDPIVNTSLHFANNTAVESGSTLYGGHLQSCFLCTERKLFIHNGENLFEFLSDTELISGLDTSSDPYRVCVCETNQIDCTQSQTTITVYPGQVLMISVAAVGQMNGIVPSVIRTISENLMITADFKVTQPTQDSKVCSQLEYPLFSTRRNAKLQLYSDEPCSTSGFPFTYLITFNPCPVGFTLSVQGDCICEERMQKYTQICVIHNLTIIRQHDDSFWVGVDNHSGTERLILHPHCPFDFCTNEVVSFLLNNTDSQCTNRRSGILCGACQSGHSLVLGSSRCLSDCSNKPLALLLAFALAGIVLVAFLFLCRLTVAEGTLSGLIFYANVLAVNQSVFFPSGKPNVLTVFIAWLNLDLGIETCFFTGLDAYSRTWLQFVFPIYIWVLVGCIIYLADTSTFFAKIIGGTNPVAVLATLFLLSYAKLLRAIMAAFSFTTLEYPSDERKLVWLYDGNIGYLDKQDGRHIVLFLVSLLVLLFVFLPYTFLLLCGQWIQSKFRLGWLSPTKQLYMNSFLDAHYAPYRNRNRYWTGVLLLLRFIMILLTTITNVGKPQDPLASLVVLGGIVSGVQLWVWLVANRLYKKWCLDVLEASFIFNLIILIMGTYQVRLSGGNQAALVHTSVGIAFITFIGIVMSGLLQCIKNTRFLKNLNLKLTTFNRQSKNSDEEEPTPAPSPVAVSTVTYSIVDIVRLSQGGETSGDIEMRPL